MNRRTSEYDMRAVARHLRGNPTEAEALLWQHLRAKRLCGLRFRRKHPVGKCIADFACPKRKLVVELDLPFDDIGTIGDGCYKSRGYKALRISSENVLTNISEILKLIESSCEMQET